VGKRKTEKLSGPIASLGDLATNVYLEEEFED
jgi:hypothetical protein